MKKNLVVIVSAIICLTSSIGLVFAWFISQGNSNLIVYSGDFNLDCEMYFAVNPDNYINEPMPTLDETRGDFLEDDVIYKKVNKYEDNMELVRHAHIYAGRSVEYRINVTNNSQRSARVKLILPNMLKYYAEDFTAYLDDNSIVPIFNDSFSARILFSVRGIDYALYDNEDVQGETISVADKQLFNYTDGNKDILSDESHESIILPSEYSVQINFRLECGSVDTNVFNNYNAYVAGSEQVKKYCAAIADKEGKTYADEDIVDYVSRYISNEYTYLMTTDGVLAKTLTLDIPYFEIRSENVPSAE